MDIAYDHIQEEALTPEEAARKTAATEQDRQQNLNTEFQEAYKSFTSSAWGTRLGGFFNDVKKQGTSIYDGARQEASTASGEAFKGFSSLRETVVSHARSMSAGTNDEPSTPRPLVAEEDGTEPTSSETSKEGESVINRFRNEAAKRLKDLERAEDAADAAIFKFGANIGNFLKEAVTVAAPTEEQKQTGKVLFESKDQDGKRVIHSTRLGAQLHAIHSNTDSFSKDSTGPEWEKWKSEFDIEKKTEAISKDLEKYEELRRTMEKLVPEKVEYAIFWTRYYYLRMVVETEEERRREILKGATQDSTADQVAWDDDSDSDNEQSSTPLQKPRTTVTHSDSASVKTLKPEEQDKESIPSASNTLKPVESRRSQDQHSQPDSDASYDLVSGATSRAPGSPKETKAKGPDDEEEEDWE